MPKGKHKGPRFVLSVSAEQLATWRKAADRNGRALAGWLRKVADDAADWELDDTPYRGPETWDAWEVNTEIPEKKRISTQKT